MIAGIFLYWTKFYNYLHGDILFFSIAYSGFLIVIAAGMLKLKNWARLLLLLSTTIKIMDICYRNIPHIFKNGPARIVGIFDIIIAVLIAGIIFWFFTKETTKKEFLKNL